MKIGRKVVGLNLGAGKSFSPAKHLLDTSTILPSLNNINMMHVREVFFDFSLHVRVIYLSSAKALKRY